jgi:hypothetical protein
VTSGSVVDVVSLLCFTNVGTEDANGGLESSMRTLPTTFYAVRYLLPIDYLKRSPSGWSDLPVTVFKI